MEEKESGPKGIVHSNRIKAGKRTYFVDVRATKVNDYYITLTESTKKRNGDKEYYVRNKILLYKEDFNKVLKGLVDTIDLIKTDLMTEYDFDKFDRDRELGDKPWDEGGPRQNIAENEKSDLSDN